MTQKAVAKALPVRMPAPLTGLVWPLVALAAVLATNLLFSHGFFHVEIKDGHLYGSLIDILSRATPVMLLSLGMTLVVATGGVDLSVGAVTAIAGAAVALLLGAKGASLPVAIGGALLAALAAGLWNGLLVAWLDVQPIVATLVLMVAGRGLAQLMTGGQVLPIEQATFQALGSGYVLGVPPRLVVILAAFLATLALTRGTAAGLFVRAVGNGPAASRYAGVNAALVTLVVYAFSGLCAGVSGLIIAADIGAADVNNSGLYLELDAILAVVLGGTALTGGPFSLGGSLIGALIIQSVTTSINTNGLPVEWTLAVKAVVVLAACLIQSEPLRRKVAGVWRRRQA